MYKDLVKSGDVSGEEILKALMTADRGVPMKTHILDPVTMDLIKVFAVYLKSRGLEKTSSLYTALYKAHLVHMVSYKRLGRKEIIEGLKTLNEMKLNTSNVDKAFGRNR